MARIVVVDDVPGMRAVAATLLRHAGHEVHTAGSGQAALELIEADPPDLILLDVMMPGMDGLEVLERLSRKGQGCPLVPVVMLTATSDEATRRRAQLLGASAFVVKGDSALEEMVAEVARHF